jgi:hypothetical protein
MSDPLAIAPSKADEERRIRIAKTIVLCLACVVGVILATTFVFAMYNYTTDRPAKELFQKR